MIKAALIEDYIRNHPGATLHDMGVEFGITIRSHVKRLEKEKRIYWQIDLRDRKTKHFYLKENGDDKNGVFDPEI